eukprot:g3896.t1
MRNIKLYSSNSSGQKVSNASGVSIRPIDFGGVNGVEYSNYGTWDPIKIPYMKALIDSLESVGYERGVSLRAATYDFRSAGVSDVLDVQFRRLRSLVEETYETNGKLSVHLLSHSLGGPYTTTFLNTAVNSDWKSKYVASHIMLSAPLLGTNVATEAMILGPSYDDVPQVLPRLAVPAIRTWPSVIWMLPRSYGVANSPWKGLTLVKTPTATYGEDDAQQMIDDIGSEVLSNVFEDVHHATNASAKSPGVPVFCAYANDTKTTMTIELDTDIDGAKTDRVTKTSMGDGTVPLASLSHCKSWADTALHRPYEFGGSLAAHTEIVRLPALLDDINEWTAKLF